MASSPREDELKVPFDNADGRKRKVEEEESESEYSDSEQEGDSTDASKRARVESTQSVDGETQSWSITDSDNLYHVSGWGAPYFKINDEGHVEVSPSGQADADHTIDLFDLVEDVIQRGHNLPLLIRFSDILKDRIRLLNESFRAAIKEYNYNSTYKGVFPVKVCQQRRVVKEIVKYGKPYMYGLEAGSKPELLIVLAELHTRGALITCNGYKDSEYVETALIAQQLGQIPILVIEKLHELPLVIQAAKKLNIKPLVGVRAKLSTRGVGRWCHSSGDHAKFGLSSADIMEVVRMLRQENMLDSLQLLHFHIGSQISRIAVVKDALREATQFFVELYKLGANMKYLDVGGGLGIDYDGSKTSFAASMNYTIGEYAADVVCSIKEICDKNNVPHPTIVSESGRAVCSHQTVLVFSVLSAARPMRATEVPTHAVQPGHTVPHATNRPLVNGSSASSSSSSSSLSVTVPSTSPIHPSVPFSPSSSSSSASSSVTLPTSTSSSSLSSVASNGSSSVPSSTALTVAGAHAHAHTHNPLKAAPVKPAHQEHFLVQNMYEIWSSISPKNLQEVYHDATQYKSEALTLFTLGLMTLEERAKVEELYWRCLIDIMPHAAKLRHMPEELQALPRMMSYIYYCNISVFQSAPDAWAIDQLFPIIPIHRLDEKPTALATLADITIDSEGKIDKFISSGQHEHKDLLELHELDEDKPYYLGMFLNGAYQEVLGNLQNLFGDTNVIHVELDPEDEKVGYSVEHVVKGDTTNEVLESMEYNPKMMLESIRLQSEQALNHKRLTLPQYRLLVKHYEKALQKYTYLWADEDQF